MTMDGRIGNILKVLTIGLLGMYILFQGTLGLAYGETGLSSTSPMLLGQEYRDVGGFNVDLHYGPGFAYSNTPYLSTYNSNLIDVYLSSPEEVGEWPHYKPVEYQVMMWYSNAIHSQQAPYYNLLGISDVFPRGYVEIGGYITHGVSYQLSSQVSMGAEKLLELGSERTFGLSWSSTVPTGYEIDINRDKEEYTYTAEQVREDVQKKVCEGDDPCVYLGGGNDWLLRYEGEIEVKKKETLPTALRFLISTRTQNYWGSYTDNTLRDRPLMVLFAVAKYKSTHTWLTWDDFKVRGITFILGDDSEAGGDDGYLWYYRTDKIISYP